MTHLRADLDQTVHLAAKDFTWQPSPLPGVERVMLDRVGDEVAVATSIVRYAPEAYFDPHDHALGEEFLVLEGVFSDEHGDYPAGTYVRNPPGTRHTPFSRTGCTIFVKLRQFDTADLTQMHCTLPNEVGDTPEHTELFRYGSEVVSAVTVPAGVRYAFNANRHVRELLVLSGELTWQQNETYTLPPHSWIRMRPGEPLRIVAQSDCVVFSKTRPVYRAADE